MIAAAQTYGTFIDHLRTVGLAAAIFTTIAMLPKIGRALLARARRPHTVPPAGRPRRVVGTQPERRGARTTPTSCSRRPDLRIVR